jgi:hypothetical protein
MRPADLDDLFPIGRLGFQRRMQVLKCGDQVVCDLLCTGDVHRRREGVIRRLAHIDVVVGVDRLLRAHSPAHHLDGAVRDNFIGVHVGLGARAGLPYDQREMVVQLAVDHFLRRCDDVLCKLRVELAEFEIRLCRCTLHDAERTDNRGRLLLPADLEIAQRALRLSAPIPVRRDLDGAKGVGLRAGFPGHVSAAPNRQKAFLNLAWH